MPLASGRKVSQGSFTDGPYRGRQVRWSGYDGVDVEVTLSLAIDAETDELLIQLEQSGGTDTVYAVRDLYRFEKPTSAGGYMVLPHGSGYLINADCTDEVPGGGEFGGLIGARWALPMFGMVRGNDGMCAIVDTWWECDVVAEHIPGERSTLRFSWEASLGELGYPRRLLIRFGQGMDHVAMAKLYREHARKNGLLRTLEEKSQSTPIIRKYVNNVLFRWVAWNDREGAAVLEDIRRLQAEGMGINFFYPKWSSLKYDPDNVTPVTADSGWQAFLHTSPVPGGWDTLIKLEEQLHEMGAVIQAFVCPISQERAAVGFDEDRCAIMPEGQRRQWPIGSYDALDRMNRVFDSLEKIGLKLDVLYYDGFAAHVDLPQDFSLAHPMTRRQNIEAEVACFAETRRRGIMPGAELARFWAMGQCDYFFFTDWSNDRLANTPGAEKPVGVPIPLLQLVFGDCFIAGFSGGGYATYVSGFDWWSDRTPRLYELMFASAPSFNWLPDAAVPVPNWDAEQQRRKRAWLKDWNAYYRQIALSEMVSHQFGSDDGTRQRVEFANGVAAEFNLTENLYRIEGIKEFSGDWQTPPNLYA